MPCGRRTHLIRRALVRLPTTCSSSQWAETQADTMGNRAAGCLANGPSLEVYTGKYTCREIGRWFGRQTHRPIPRRELAPPVVTQQLAWAHVHDCGVSAPRFYTQSAECMCLAIIAARTPRAQTVAPRKRSALCSPKRRRHREGRTHRSQSFCPTARTPRFA